MIENEEPCQPHILAGLFVSLRPVQYIDPRQHSRCGDFLKNQYVFANERESNERMKESKPEGLTFL